MGVYSQPLRKLWKEWNVQTLVLLSLTFQILLVCFGSRRKYNRKQWIRIVVWFAYLFADSVATLALGAISNALLDIYDNSGNVNPEVELKAFWASFLLLHLGGPDTITAYALEDNELWLRHLLGLFVQAGGAVYVSLLAWTGSRLSVLTVLMILVGLFKYGERIWVLWRASSGQLEHLPCQVTNILVDDDIISHEGRVSQESIIFVAYRLIGCYMPSIVRAGHGEFLYEVVSDSILEAPASIISKLIEVELGFMYDLLYTKARVVYTPCSLALRLIGFFLTCIVLVLFSIGVTQKNNYSKVDLAITFVLLVGAITIDLYAAFALLSSNWTTALLYGRTQTQNQSQTQSQTQSQNSCYKAISYYQKYLNNSPSWSNSISQFSLLRFAFGEKHVRFGGVLKLFPRVHEKLAQQGSITYTEVTDILKEHTILKVQQKRRESPWKRRESPFPTQGVLLHGNVDGVLQKHDCSEKLDSYKGRDIEENIIVWHIATELCYYLEDAKAAGDVQSEQREISLHISQYMLSLLAIYPSMLSAKVNESLFEKTCYIVDGYMSCRESISLSIRKSDDFRQLYNDLRFRNQPIENPAYCLTNRKLFPAAVSLSLKLDEISSKEMKWGMIINVWLEMLLYVASQWKGNEHAQQLRRGGELLTHVWFLMVLLDLV